MELIRIELLVQADELELLTACLASELSYGWEEESLPDGRARCIVYAENELFAQELAAAITARMPRVEVRRSMAPQLDWVEAWKVFFTPVSCGTRFIVLAPWMTEEKQQALSEGRQPVVIEPKTAFGTGHHASTALCLRGLSRLLDQGRIKPGQRFLDLGTGSGILAIGAARSGLSGLALDIDMLAVENALENLALNEVADKVVVRRGSLGSYFPSTPTTPATSGTPTGHGGGNDLLEPVSERFDLICANILAEPLKALAPYIVARLKPGGLILLSGILEPQARDVADVYRRHGMPEPEFEYDGEWTLLVFGGNLEDK